MVEITLPIPAFLSYFWKNATVKTKKGIRGAIIFVLESPILYAACVSSGEKPRRMNIGTKIGAMIAHFAESTAMKMLINAVKTIKLTRRGIPVKPTDSRKLAPDTEIIVPRFE